MITWIKKHRWLTITLSVVVVLVCALLWFHASLKRDLEAPRFSRLILDRRGHYLGELPAPDGNLGYWPLPVTIPDKILVTTVETEDRYFFQHGGVHLRSVFRALWQNLKAGRTVSGASTIAMQVAHMQSPGSRTLWRKLREAAEARLLVSDHGHDRVLRHYLTIAPYGNRIKGVARAARYYFDKPVEDLSWLQAAFLAGLPQAPGRMDPHHHKGLHRALARAHRILGTLHERGKIDEEEYRQALSSELRLVEKPRRRPEAMHAVLRWSRQAGESEQPILHATLDLQMQERVAKILHRNLRHWRFLGAGNTAGLVVDARTGDVLVYLGSDDYFEEEARGAIDFVTNKRSPGSALKPFLYALALEKGLLTASSELPDIHVEFPDHRGQTYVPRNITHNFLGPMLFREALANSRNIPALRVLAAVGVEPSLSFFERAGVSGVSYQPNRYGLGLALGNLHVTLEELVGLYATLANQGRTLPLRFFLDREPVPGRRVLDRGVSQLVTHILADPLARMPSFARGSQLEYDYAVAVKTGTSQGYRDAWAVGFSDRLLVGVWVGNHDWRRMNHLGGLAGAAGALRRVLDGLMPHHLPHQTLLAEFPPPDGYAGKQVCALSGKLAGPDCPHHRVEYFLPGTEPHGDCPYHKKVYLDRRNGMLATPDCSPAFVEEQVRVRLPEKYEPWARSQHLELAPKQISPHCAPPRVKPRPSIWIAEPRENSRYLWDPDTPAEFATIRLAARVTPRDEEIVWIVDGIPVARVGYPHEFRWSFRPGKHVIQAALAHQSYSSTPVTVTVAD